MLPIRRGIIGCCVIIAITTCGCGRLFRGGGVGQPVTVAKVESRRTSPEMTVASTLIPSDRAPIALPQAVRIKRVLVNIGSQVIKGDPLLELDDTDIRTELRQLSATLQEDRTTTDQNRFLMENREKLRAEGKLTEVQANGLEKEIAVNEARIARLEADIAALEQSLTQTTIPSPIDGVVTAKHVSANQEVAENQPMLEVINIDPILASFRLSADEAGGITTGTTVRVRVEELPGETFDGHITYVGPELHAPDNTFVVWAAIPNGLEVLKSGMHSFTEFRSTKTHDVFVVPSSAIVMRQNRPHLFLIKEGIAKLTRIHVKSIDQDEAIVVGGVTAGQWVIVKGYDGLEDGMIVDIR